MTDDSPLPFPPGCRMAFCIGAQKAGTTWLYEMLQGSPDCYFGPTKEMHYFDVRSGREGSHLKDRVALVQRRAGQLLRDDDAVQAQIQAEDQAVPRLNAMAAERVLRLAQLLQIYSGPDTGPDRHAAYVAHLMHGHAGQTVLCDFTPSYAVLGADDYAEMAALGQARFVFLMRDPVARMWSQTRMFVAEQPKAPAPGSPAFLQACVARIAEQEASGRLPVIERADYRRTITALESAVPPERIHYAFFERLFQQETVDGICAFLGMRPVRVDAARRVNEGLPVPVPPETTKVLRRAFAPQYDFVRARFGAAVPEDWQG